MIVACVWTGTKYQAEYVHRLHRAVMRHLPIPHRFVCLTDRARDLRGTGIECVHADYPGWWAKMELFKPEWREGERVVFLDLDTVIVGDLSPLAEVESEFAICDCFLKRLGVETKWPCRYGSCVMVLGETLGGDVWRDFEADSDDLMQSAGRHGDQQVIEWLHPLADILQDILPGFFLHYRELPEHPGYPPEGASLVIFGGSQKPTNCRMQWVRRAWVREAWTGQ